MSRSALVTGASGFVGEHLRAALRRDGWQVTAFAPAGTGGTSAPGERWIEGDLRSGTDVARAAAGPFDAVFHLAAISFLPDAGDDPGVAIDVNVAGTVRLLSALAGGRASGVHDPAVLIVGSSEQYGRQPPEALPLAETARQMPLSVYGATKCAQEIFALREYRSSGLKVICTRSFSHSGAGQPDRFLVPALVGRSLALRAGRSTAHPRLPIGNATPIRDYLHVLDVVGAYARLVEEGVAGEVYNVCSGTGISVEELARRVLGRVGIDAEVYSDPLLARPVEVPALVGDPSKLRSATAWRPIHSIDDVIDDLIHAATH